MNKSFHYLWDLIKMGNLHGEEGDCCSHHNELVFTVEGINPAFISVSAMPGLSLSYLCYKNHQNPMVATNGKALVHCQRPKEALQREAGACSLWLLAKTQGKNPLSPLPERNLIYSAGNAPRYLSCHTIVCPGSRAAGLKCCGSKCPK